MHKKIDAGKNSNLPIKYVFDGQYMLSSELVHFEFSRQHKYYYPANHIFSIWKYFRITLRVVSLDFSLPSVCLDTMDVGEGLTVFLEETQR